MRTLCTLSLSFLLPGIAGLLLASSVSTYYLLTLPRTPAPSELRIMPRNIHGVIVYQSVTEDRNLTLVETGSVCVFLVGLVAGLVYLHRWGAVQALGADEQETMAR